MIYKRSIFHSTCGITLRATDHVFLRGEANKKINVAQASIIPEEEEDGVRWVWKRGLYTSNPLQLKKILLERNMITIIDLKMGYNGLYTCYPLQLILL